MTSPMFTRGFSFGMVTPLELEGVGTVALLEGVILVTNSRKGKGESAENGSNPTMVQGEQSAARTARSFVSRAAACLRQTGAAAPKMTKAGLCSPCRGRSL